MPSGEGGWGLGTKLCVLHVPECDVGFVSQPAVFMFECVLKVAMLTITLLQLLSTPRGMTLM